MLLVAEVRACGREPSTAQAHALVSASNLPGALHAAC